MSARSTHAAVRKILVLLAILAVASNATYAAEPNAPPEPSRPDATKGAIAGATTQPRPSQPVRPAVRTPASFSPQMPLSEAIDILRNCTRPPLNLIVLWRDLDNAGIYRDTPIGLDGISGLRIGQYLDMLVASLSAGASAKIGYAVHGGVITIATTTALPIPKQTTRVYDISDLVAPPANYSFPSMGFGGMGNGGMGYGGMYGNQMMGLSGGYGGGLGTGYGMGSSYMPGGSSGLGGTGGFPGLVGSSYGTARGPRGR